MSVRWTSHRGLRENHIENSRGAFDAAIASGFRSLETDLRSTADGHIVLHHDNSMERTAGISAKVEELTLEEFTQCRYKDGQQGLTLESLMSMYSDCYWIFDIKEESALKTMRTLSIMAKDKKVASWLSEKVRFLLWSQKHEAYLSEVISGAVTLARESECRRAGVSVLSKLSIFSGMKEGRVYALPPSFYGLDLYRQGVIGSYHRRGAKVLAYLPESREEIKNAIGAGVDEVLTNGCPLE